MKNLSVRSRRLIVRCTLGVIVLAAAILMAVFLPGKILNFKTYTLSERALGLRALDFCGKLDFEGNEFTLVFSQ